MTDIEEYFKELIGDDVNFYLGVRDDENMGEKLSVTVIATGIADGNQGGGYDVRQAAPASQSRFGTANIPSLDNVGFGPASSAATAPVAPAQPVTERQIGQMRTVNPSSFSAGNLKPRVVDMHMDVPSFLRKKNGD